MVGADEDAGLETPLKDEKFVIRIVRLQPMYKGKVCWYRILSCRLVVVLINNIFL